MAENLSAVRDSVELRISGTPCVSRANARALALARLAAVAAGCAALASCATSPVVLKQQTPVAAQPEKVAVATPPVRKPGTTKPYVVAGKRYVPRSDPSYTAIGLASWYGSGFHGHMTADGERFNMMGLTAAHKTMPLPSYARVTNMDNGMSIVVRVNDRGPYARGRLIDVSRRTADLLQFRGSGVGKVKVEYVGRAPDEVSDTKMLLATLRTDGSPAPAPSGAPTTMFADATPPTPPRPVPVEGDDVMARQAPVPQLAPVSPAPPVPMPQLASADGTQLVTEAKRVAVQPDTATHTAVAFNLASLPLPPERPQSTNGVLGKTMTAESVGQVHLHHPADPEAVASKSNEPDAAPAVTAVAASSTTVSAPTTATLPTFKPTPAIAASMGGQ